MAKPNISLQAVISKKASFGLSLQSSVDDIVRKLGRPDGDWEKEGAMYYDDLQIGLRQADGEFRPVYFGVYPRKTDGDNLIIRNVDCQSISDADLSLTRILALFDARNIGYGFDPKRDCVEEQKFLGTEFGDELFFLKDDSGQFLLDAAFLTSM